MFNKLLAYGLNNINNIQMKLKTIFSEKMSAKMIYSYINVEKLFTYLIRMRWTE